MFRRNRKSLIALPLALAAVAALAVTGFARERYEEKFARTEALARDGRVRLANVSGDIRVETWAQEQVKIAAVKTSEAGSAEDAKANAAEVTIEVVREGSLLRIETRYPKRAPWGRRNANVSVEFTVTIPDRAGLEVHSVSGDVAAEAIGGELKLDVVSGNVEVRKAARTVDAKSVSGEVTVEDGNGDAWLNSVSGNVSARRLKGSIDAESVSGEISLLDVTGAKSIDAKTVSGDVEYRGDLSPQGMYKLGSHSGNVILDLPADASFEFEANTFSGVIESAFPVQMSGKISPRELHGTVGKGGASVRLSTFSGNVDLRKR